MTSFLVLANIFLSKCSNFQSSHFLLQLYNLKKYSRYGGTWIKVDRVREQHTLDLHMGVPWETVTLTSFGRNKELYFNILEEGKIFIVIW